jgi:gliding motility-associated-like protein
MIKNHHFMAVIVLCFTGMTAMSQVNLSQGLVAYYPLNGNANDVSGNGNNGALNGGVQLTTDRFGNLNSAYLFDGIDDFIQVANSATLNQSTALTIVAYFNAAQHGTQTIIGKIDYINPSGTQFQLAMDYAPYPGILYGVNPSNNGCVGAANNGAYVNTATTVALNQWYCAVATFDNGAMRFYVNGTLISSTNSGFSTLNSCPNATMQIGSWWNGDPQRFKGKIDDVRIYDRALNQQEIDVLCPLLPCSDWLKITNAADKVQIGDLDVTGNKITVEANFNRVAPWTGSYSYAGDLVSKHENRFDCNYLLRVNHAEITTTNGYFATPAVCDIELNKTYHAAMVYDGVTLKFYRNGFLMSQVAATGNLVQNNWPASIGNIASSPPPVIPENMNGFINEVRIWNTDRSQADIRQYMNTSLPTPSTQPGLLAYYAFDDIANKQGNSAWNGVLVGNAAIRQVNTSCAFVADSCKIIPPTVIIPSFTAPDTVCINDLVNITNTTIGASSYYWNFCTGNLNNLPVGTNMGNIGNAFTSPVYIDYVSDNGNYYGFATDNSTGNLIRMDFGSSLLNVPTIINYRNLGTIPIGAEGIQVVKNEGKWYAIIVGGGIPVSPVPYIVKIEFGASITNPSPVATNWGNLGNMKYAHDLYVFNDGANWYGLTVNSDNNTITRFDFTTSFSNIPIATNLGNIGNLSGPTGIYAINENGNWYAFVTNAVSHSITRLDFGSSLLNMPTGLNLGTLGNTLHAPWDIYFIKFCGELLAYVINADGNYNEVLKIDFKDNIMNTTPSVVNFGNIGALSFPHCISKIFRVGANLYTFIPNVLNQTITRLEFTGCSNASIPSSTAQNPPPVKYNAPGTYNINLTVDDGLPSQTATCKQVVVMPAPVQSPTLQKTICKGEIIRIGTGNKYGHYLWSTGATTDSIDVSAVGTYWVETNSFGCKATDTIKIIPNLVSDFSFRQDACNPYQVQFFNAGTATLNPYWDLGDGNIITGSLNTVHTYPVFGDYTIRFSVQQGVCVDTVTKTIVINAIKDDIIITPDTTICYGDTKQLRTKSALSFCWSPATYLDNPLSPNPVTNTPQNITYYFTAELPGNNLIANGDFSAGNAGIVSAYKFAAANTTEEEYSVGTNSQAWNAAFSACTDHTNGKGNMMLVNGSPAADVSVWAQTITVTPNTSYAFSTWIQALYTPNPAILSFTINGKDIGTPITAALPTCTWKQFYITWNSGSSTTATIAIVNKNTQVQGNDFALDDISFAPLQIKRDSVVITVEKPLVKTGQDTTVCIKNAIPLHTTGALQYMWLPQIGLSDPHIANPVAYPEGPTQYIVTGTTINGCVANDTIQVNTFTKPLITKTGDTSVCQNSSLPLFASGGQSYTWSPATGLSDSNIAGPIASISASNITYSVKITDLNYCDYTELVKLSVRPYPVFTASGNKAICYGDATTLTAAGGDSYQWSPANTLASPNAPSTTANPETTTQYNVHIQETTCYFDTTISMTVKVNPLPKVTAKKANDINCNIPSAQLNAYGALRYTWSPAAGLDNPYKVNPVSTADTSVVYLVEGTNEFGCTAGVYIPVAVTKEGIPRFVVPNAFSPNGDGNNDCFGIKRWGNAKIEEFAVFNRWGQLIFKTNKPSQCWDGRFNGKPQDSGGYVYIIKAQTLCGPVTTRGVVMLIR